MIPLAVMAGGALGSVARYGVGLVVARAMGQGFPWGTVLINIAGSFVIGWFAALALRMHDRRCGARFCHGGPVRRLYDLLGL